ncbi:peptidase U62, modulator of DNA gyrase [Planomonospora parontospora subsp. parontospora]|uniref:Peptidase U62, modulator of DNA gyrase n=2 Tax=Planomonospora parontospora TaxID=58119 RepID=A0AA37BG66_9ACTN|nr:TldD/PmbA family protein [Planomonospora parontospora]GGK66648.1 peptidase U62, modulator of DNA gyrase [Planomonospora parontospora]GII08515.1 peptidase U62, modulator of DNA gyrase [Planomonospora parontospora subsp. parontospora]
MRQIDSDFLALPMRRMADAALQRARDLGAEHADFRLERVRAETLRLSDARLEGSIDADDLGYAVRVVKNGTWGFASGIELTPEAAAAVAEQAVEVAVVSAAVNREPIELAPEPVHADVTWVSAYDVDPFDVPLRDKVELLADWSGGLLKDPRVDHVQASLMQVKEQKFYADTAGTRTTQQRVRVHPVLDAMKVGEGRFEEMRTLAPPVGRGYEYLTGTGWDFPAELAALPELLEEKLRAPSVEAGVYDLVIDPSNLWLTIHESIGHATELDRALGYEAAYAGTSFATFDQLGSLVYGSPAMNVTGDRTAVHGLSTIGYDDEGVATREFDIVSGGVLVGYQLDRRMARMKDLGVSNGCAFADSPGHMPIQRMANVSLRPAPGGPSTDELIAGVERGVYVVGDKSWSIDMQRYNFQFTGQRFYRIENGRLAGQLRDVAYQATTTDFWRSMEAVGGEQTYVLGGAFNCGKGQPGQVAPVSHGCPSALFRGVRVLNTVQEGGK